jgi:hypothetical protein
VPTADQFVVMERGGVIEQRPKARPRRPAVERFDAVPCHEVRTRADRSQVVVPDGNKSCARHEPVVDVDPGSLKAAKLLPTDPHVVASSAVLTATRCGAEVASRRAGSALPGRACPRQARRRRPRSGLVWRGQVWSGCLGCAAGGRGGSWHPRAPGPGRVALAAGGWPRVVGPEARLQPCCSSGIGRASVG